MWLRHENDGLRPGVARDEIDSWAVGSRAALFENRDQLTGLVHRGELQVSRSLPT